MSYKTEDYIASGSYGRWAGKYILQEIPWGKDLDISDSCTERLFGEKPMVRFNFKKYNLLLVLNSIAESPIPMTEEELSKLPKSLGERLFEIANRINSVDQKSFLPKLETADSKIK